MFDKKKLKQNRMLILILLGVIIAFVILSFLFNGKQNSNLQESDIDVDGESSVGTLVINEIMTSNSGALAAPNRGSYDWIELYNGSNQDINLANYGLSDEENKSKWAFPDVAIKAKSYLVVYLSGTNEDGLYANFKLSSSGGVETLSLNKNQVMARNNNGDWILTSIATPGYPNTEEGRSEYINSIRGEEADIEIIEVLPNNAGHFKDNYGNYSGYIEIKNKTDKTISLKEYGLSGDISNPFKWQFPDETIEHVQEK